MYSVDTSVRRTRADRLSFRVRIENRFASVAKGRVLPIHMQAYSQSVTVWLTSRLPIQRSYSAGFLTFWRWRTDAAKKPQVTYLAVFQAKFARSDHSHTAVELAADFQPPTILHAIIGEERLFGLVTSSPRRAQSILRKMTQGCFDNRGVCRFAAAIVVRCWASCRGDQPADQWASWT